jgi:hypothetical protein
MVDFLPHGATAPSGPGPPHCRGFTITLIYPTRQDSSGRVISPTQRPLPDITQQSLETDIHALSGIRTRNPSKRAAAEPNLRLRGHRDQPNGRMFEYNQVVWILRK